MSIYTASEKTELLRKIAEAKKDIFVIRDKMEVSIAETCLIPDKCIKQHDYLLGDCLQCEITEIGKMYLKQGIYEKEEALIKEKEKADELEIENIRLSNNKLKFEKNTRWMAIISLLVSIVSLGTSIIGLHQNHPETLEALPCDSVSTNSEIETPSPNGFVAPFHVHQSKAQPQCPQNRDSINSQTSVVSKHR